MTPPDTFLLLVDFCCRDLFFLHGEEVNDEEDDDIENKLDRDESNDRLLSSRLGELSRLGTFMLLLLLLFWMLTKHSGTKNSATLFWRATACFKLPCMHHRTNKIV